MRRGEKLFLRAIANDPGHVNASVNLGALCLDLAATPDHQLRQRTYGTDPHLRTVPDRISTQPAGP